MTTSRPLGTVLDTSVAPASGARLVEAHKPKLLLTEDHSLCPGCGEPLAVRVFLDAIDHYDPERGVPFASYAAPRIRGAIVDDLRRLDCVPRRTRRRLRDAQRAMEALAQELDREPTDTEVAAKLGVSLAAYQQLLSEGVTLVSLDGASRDDEARGTMLNALADGTTMSPLGVFEQGEQRRMLARLI